MRSDQTEAESALWSKLLNRRLGNLKFRRQVPIGNYIVDFLCIEYRLIVEGDGSQHTENEYDNRRDKELQKREFTVLRFWNNDVLQNIENVCEAIIAAVEISKSERE